MRRNLVALQGGRGCHAPIFLSRPGTRQSADGTASHVDAAASQERLSSASFGDNP